MKRNKLWSFALAGALAVSNLSAVVMPMTAMAAKEISTKPTKAYFAKAEQAAEVASNNANMTVNLTFANGWHEDGTAYSAAEIAALAEDFVEPTYYELKKGNTAVYHGAINAAGTAEAAVITLTDVEDFDGVYTVNTYYGTSSEAVAPTDAAGALVKNGLKQADSNTFEIFTVSQTAVNGTVTKYNVVEGDKHTVAAGSDATSLYFTDPDGNYVLENAEVAITKDNSAFVEYAGAVVNVTYQWNIDNATDGAGNNTNTVVAFPTNKPAKTTDLSAINGINGKIFLGWSKNAAATKVDIQPGGTFSTDGAKTLYGVWGEGYVVRFWNNTVVTAATTMSPTVTQEYKNAITLPSTANDPDANATRSFVGWSTTVADTQFDEGTDFAPGGSFPYSTANESAVTSVTYTPAQMLAAAPNDASVGAALAATMVDLYAILAPVVSIEYVTENIPGYITSAKYSAKNWDVTTSNQMRGGAAGQNLASGTGIATGTDVNVVSAADLKQCIQNVPLNTSVTLNANVYTSDKYNFIGWAVDDDVAAGKVSFTDKATVTVGTKSTDTLNDTDGDGVITLTAIWEPKTEFDVDYVSNRPGEGSQYDSTAGRVNFYEGVAGTISNGLIAGVRVSRTGYELIGWSENASATTAQYTLGQKDVTITKDMTLYAVWKANGGNTSGENKPSDSSQATTPTDTTGIKAGETKKVSNVTYKAQSDGTSVQVTKTPNKKTVTIKKTVKINNKTYKVTKIGAKAVTGKNVKNVTIDATNIKKANNINISMFKGAKNLTKVTIKGAKKNSAVAKRIVKAAQKVNKDVKIAYK